MAEFLVYRQGSNKANQPMTFEPIPIAVVEAESEEKAAETTWGDEKPNVHGCPTLAAKVVQSCGNLDVWANQRVHAVPIEYAPPEDLEALSEAAAMAETREDE